MTTTTHDTSAALEAAIDAIACRRCDHDDPIGSTDRSALHRAITAHVEAEVARRLAAAPDVEAAIVRHDDDTYWRGYRHGGGKVPPDWEDVPRDDHALRVAIAADKARAVEAAIEGTGRAEQFADAICHRVGARDSGCGGQTVEAGTARLYADAAKRIDDLIARDKARPTPDEARSIGRVAEHLRGLAAEVEPSRMADGFDHPAGARHGDDRARSAGGAVLAPDPPDRDPTLPIPQRT